MLKDIETLEAESPPVANTLRALDDALEHFVVSVPPGITISPSSGITGLDARQAFRQGEPAPVGRPFLALADRARASARLTLPAFRSIAAARSFTRCR